MKKFMLVYQGGLANLFEVNTFSLAPVQPCTRQRIYQGDFRSAENMAIGAKIAGAEVRTAGCNTAGDIAECVWTYDLEELPFSEKFCPVDSEIGCVECRIWADKLLANGFDSRSEDAGCAECGTSEAEVMVVEKHRRHFREHNRD